MKTIFSTYKMAIGYGLLFLLAIILRFQQLGNPMLGEKEAAFALQAINGAPSLFGGIAGASGLSAMISPILFVFGKSDVAARVIPALFGTLIILVPFLFRRVLGDKAAICLSILFMFDPSLTAYSRQVDGAIITVCGFLFALGFVLNRKYSAAGIAAGFALLGSPILWPGLLAVGLAFWLTFLVQGKSTDDDEEPAADLVFSRDNLIKAGIALILTIVLVGSTFLTNLGGIAAPVLNLTAYVQGWAKNSDVSIFLMLFSFILYQPFVFITGLFEGIRTSRSGERINAFLLRWFFFSLLLAIFYPSRGMDALLFTYLPLLVLSARFIVRLIQSLEMPDIPAYGEMILVILLLVFCWLNLLAIKFPIEGQEEALRAAAAGGAFLLLIIASILIRMGWPPKQAKTGLWMGLAVLIAIISFSTAWRSAGLGLHPEAELWNYEGVTDEMDLLKKTAGDMSEWNVSSREGINIVILDYPSSTLKWALRDFTSVNDERYIPSLSNPALVITTNEQVPSLAQAYRGQDFALTHKTSWSLILPEEWIKWYAFREVPSEKQQVILWARTDLFPGAAKTAPATITPIQ